MTTPRQLDDARHHLSTLMSSAYGQLGLLPPDTPLTPHLVAALTGTGPDTGAAVLQALADANLAHDWPGRAGLVDHGHARHAALAHPDTGSSQARHTTTGRLADWLLATAARAEALITPAQAPGQHPGPAQPAPLHTCDQAHTWLHQHRAIIHWAITRTHLAGHHDLAWRLADLHLRYLMRRRDLTAAIVLAEDYALPAACRAGAGADDGRFGAHLALAAALTRTGRHREAIGHARTALEMARRRPVTDQALALHHRGDIHRRTGEWEKARIDLGNALNRWDAAADSRGAAVSRILLGTLDPGQGLAHLIRARDDLSALGEHHDAARAIVHLARDRVRHGDLTSTMAVALQATQRVFAAGGSEHRQAQALEMRAVLAVALNGPRYAADLLDQAREQYQRAHSYDEAERVLRTLHDITAPALAL
ncbi:hypothetical protein ACFVUW_10495 [Streptomyces xiamenensis]|uniref:hypothetical protein n=1 Tax=Streptomyces xiamenensis TaxID=408015 RepID=UPI0036EF063B